MQYNTQRKRLPMPEYGREIQNMVDYAITLPTKEERQHCASTIVGIMGNMFPHLRDVPDFKHKLWDHLAIMSDFKLDIDYPYEVVAKETLAAKPKVLPYPATRIRFRHYGFMIEELLRKLETMEPGEERNQLLALAANQMKRCLYNWNKDAMDDEKIATDIARYTHGAVTLDLNTFKFLNPASFRPLSGHNMASARVNNLKRSRKRL